jgi:hypothetical protein
MKTIANFPLLFLDLLEPKGSPYVRIDVACGKNGKRGEREKKESESATNGRV